MSILIAIFKSSYMLIISSMETKPWERNVERTEEEKSEGMAT